MNLVRGPPTLSLEQELIEGAKDFYNHGVHALVTNTLAQDVGALISLLEKLAMHIQIPDIAKSFSLPGFLGNISFTLSNVEIHSLTLDPSTFIGLSAGDAVLTIPSVSATILFNWAWSLKQWGLSGSGSGVVSVTGHTELSLGINASLSGPPPQLTSFSSDIGLACSVSIVADGSFNWVYQLFYPLARRSGEAPHGQLLGKW